MKKFTLLILITTILLSFASYSQSSFVGTPSNPTNAIVNTSTDTLKISVSKGYQSLSIQPVIVRSSGTMAGMARLFYSVNGTGYIQTDSVTLSNAASQYTIWQIVNKPARYLMITIGGATTVTGSASAKITPAQ